LLFGAGLVALIGLGARSKFKGVFSNEPGTN
jgi:hypothetical protein